MKRISREEATLLLKNGHTLRDDLRPYSFDSTKYYLLTSGQIIADMKELKDNIIFDSLDEYQAFRKKTSSNNPSHYLEGFPNSEQGFLSFSDSNKEKLEDALSLSLDRTYNSLKEIDKRFNSLNINLEEYLASYFHLIVTYVYQVLAHEENAKLFFKMNKEFNIVEPYLQLSNGRQIQVFLDLYEDAEEDFQNFSVYETSRIRLDAL
jgi:hypothetical protein